MHSKISLINKGLLKQMWNSSGWMILIYQTFLLWFMPVLFTINVLSALDSINVSTEGYIADETMKELAFYAVNHTLLWICFTAASIGIAILLFRFLMSKAASEFMHALPITRKAIYWHHLLFGLAALLIPIFITTIVFTIAVYMLDVNQWVSLTWIFGWMLQVSAYTILLFAVGVAAAMLTGTSVMQGLVAYGVLLAPAFIAYTIQEWLRAVIIGMPQYGGTSDFALSSLSPIIAFPERIGYAFEVTASDLYHAQNSTYYQIEMYVYMGLAAILIGASYLLYQKRKVESATSTITFTFVHPIFKFALILIGMSFSGLYMAFYIPGQLSIFGAIPGAIFGYLIAEVFLKKTWRIPFHWKDAATYIAILVAIVGISKLLIPLYEDKIPALDDIESIEYSDYHLHAWSESDDSTTLLAEPESIATIHKLHEGIIANKYPIKRYTPEITIHYHLKNGDILKREYYLSIDDIDQLKTTHLSEYKERIINEFKTIATKASTVRFYHEEINIKDTEQVDSFTAVILKDIKENNFPSSESFYDDTPLTFELTSEPYNDWWWWSPGITKEMVHTLNWLEENGYEELAKLAM